jgi:hypothetical protein
MSAHEDSRPIDPAGGLWRVSADAWPWTPIFVAPLRGVPEEVIERGEAWLDTPRWSPLRTMHESSLVEALLALVVALVFGLAEGIVLAAIWPLWWLWRRLRGRPLDLVVRDPAGEWVPVPHDVSGWSITSRRAHVAERIRDGRLRPVPPRATDDALLSCAGPGQPLIRRRRPVEQHPTATGHAGEVSPGRR